MTQKTIEKARLFEHGQGYPKVGDYIEDDDGEIYRVRSVDRQTCQCDDEERHLHAELVPHDIEREFDPDGELFEECTVTFDDGDELLGVGPGGGGAGFAPQAGYGAPGFAAAEPTGRTVGQTIASADAAIAYMRNVVRYHDDDDPTELATELETENDPMGLDDDDEPALVLQDQEGTYRCLKLGAVPQAVDDLAPEEKRTFSVTLQYPCHLLGVVISSDAVVVTSLLLGTREQLKEPIPAQLLRHIPLRYLTSEIQPGLVVRVTVAPLEAFAKPEAS